MKKVLIMFFLPIIFFTFPKLTTHANCVIEYKSALGFKAALPLWDKAVMIQNEFHEFICAYSKDVYIKIYKLTGSNSDILHTLTWKIWDTDPNAHFIINTKTDDGGIIITTHRNKVTAIHRLRIISHNNTTFIIECSAPEKTFYNYEFYFKTVFQSFVIL